MASSTKPLVLMGCTPFYGHLMPIRVVAKDLLQRGYDVTFVSSSHYRKAIEDIGATFVPISGYGDWYDADLETRFGERKNLEPGIPQLLYDFDAIFLKSIPSQHEALRKALEILTEKHPGRPIVLVNEGFFWGGLPFTRNARGIKPTATLGIGIIPMVLSSIDTAPAGRGFPPDSSPEGRERNTAGNEHVKNQIFALPQKTFRESFEAVGADAGSIGMLDAPYIMNDRFLQMCTPSAEYPRSDAPSTIRFAGGLPKGKRDAVEPPSWWSDIANSGKKIVAVSQGSICQNHSELSIPTMEAFKDREDILLVVALGKKGASLPEGTPVPSNARVADFIPFDDLLPLCSAFISNGGYGAFQHSIANGTPIVVGGATEDKPEVAARAEWTGMGINLKTGTPTPEAIRKAVDEILENPKYKKKALELEAEMATFDPMSVVAKNIDELAAGTPLT